MTKRLSPDGFRQTHKDGSAAGDEMVLLAMPAEMKASATEDRAVDFTLSTDAIDRSGDRVSQDGWKLESYRKNPVVLWAHDYESLPVGKARNLRIEDGALKGTCIFTPPGALRFNDAVFDLIKGGFLSAVSVGFMPKKWNWAEDKARPLGIDFSEQELLEFSIVPVPANPEALIEARALGVDVEPVLRWARTVLRMGDGDEVVSKSRLDEYQAAETKLRQMQADQLVNPSPKKFPRLTERALEHARLVRHG